MERRTIKHLAAKVPKEKKAGSYKKWLVLILLLLLLGGAVYFANLREYQIEKINIEGEILTNEDLIRSKAEEELSGKYLFLIPKTFSWTYPKSRIRDRIEDMPSIVSAELDVEGSTRTLDIHIVERKQEYVWCLPAQAGQEAFDRHCYYMDKQGLVFVEAPKFEGNVFLTFEGLLDPQEPIGKSLLPALDMENLLGFIGRIKTLGLFPLNIRVVNTRELHITLRSGADLIISLEKALDPVAKSVSTLIQSEEFKEASGGIEQVKYIDLRYGSKAFWK